MLGCHDGKALFVGRWGRGISGSGTKASASMSLFRDSNYAETYPAGPVVLPVGSPLYVGVSVDESDLNFVAVLEDCFASHSSNPEDPMQYALIQNKYVHFLSLGNHFVGYSDVH